MKFFGYNINISKLLPQKGKDINKTNQAAGMVRVKQNIQKWRDALIAAERTYYPSFSEIATMYADTVSNGHVKACLKKKKDGVMSKEFGMYDASGNKNDIATKIAKSAWFTTMLEYIVDAEDKGPTLFSFGDIINSKVSQINLKPRHLLNPWERVILPYPNTPFGDKTDTPELRDWFVWVMTPSEEGNIPFGIGNLYAVAFLEIFLKNNYTQNADYNELFGSPLRWGKTSSNNDTERQRFLDDLKSMGSSGAVVTGLDDVIEFVESSSRTTGTNTFENSENRLQATISKIILGHASAMDSTPGKLGTNNDVEKAISVVINRTCNFVENIVNDHVLPRLINLGFSELKGLVFCFDNKSEEQEERDFEADYEQKVATTVKTFSDAGYEVDPKQVEEKTGWRLTKKQVESLPTTTQTDGIGTNIAKKYALDWHAMAHVNAVNKSFGGFFDILQKIIDKVWGGVSDLDPEKLELTNATFAELVKTLESLDDPKTLERYRENLFQFSSAKTNAQLAAINEAFKKTANYGDFTKAVREIDDTFNKAHLATEYGTADATVLNTIAYIKGKSLGFAKWIQIDRFTKRKTHAVLDGKVWRVEDLPFIPPIGWNCGCDLEYFAGYEGETMSKGGTLELLGSTYPNGEKGLSMLAQMKQYGFDRNPYIDGKIFDVDKIY